MAMLVPSILTKSADELREKIDFLESVQGITIAQIDFADGKFVPNKLVSPQEIGQLETSLNLEAHLMVVEPQKYFDSLYGLGFKTVFIHYESFSTKDQVKNNLLNLRRIGFRSGLAINPQTGIEVFDQFTGDFDEALIMGVQPGFQGAQFIEETFDRVSGLRVRLPNVIIEVDGGLKQNNVKRVAASGADKVNVGSGIWQTRDPKTAIEELLAEINK